MMTTSVWKCRLFDLETAERRKYTYGLLAKDQKYTHRHSDTHDERGRQRGEGGYQLVLHHHLKSERS